MSWPLVQLNEVCSFTTGGTPSTNDEANYVHGDIPWIVSGDIHRGEIFDASRRITQRGMEGSPAKFLPRNSVLIALNGQGRTRGTVALLRIAGATCNQSVVAITPNSPHTLNCRYLFMTLRSMYQQLRNLTGDKSRAGLNIGLIGKVRIPLPPLAEQKRIATILDAADALRAKRRESLAQLDTLLQSIFLDMFGDPVANPMGWDRGSLIDLCDSARGISYGVVQRGDHDADGIPLIRIRDILTGDIEHSQLIRCGTDVTSQYRRTVLYGGELVMSIRGTVGRVALVPSTLKGGNVTREIALIPLGSDVVSLFVLELLRTDSVFQRLAEDVKGVAQRGINLRDLRKLSVLQPPLDLQQRFAAIARSVERQRAAQRAHLAELDTLFASLQSRAFQGEL